MYFTGMIAVLVTGVLVFDFSVSADDIVQDGRRIG